MMKRQKKIAAMRDGTFDVAIIGGGITGTAAFREFCQRGYRVLLVDRNDFAAGTTQASGMLIWGGILYLKNFELRTVFKLSQARDSLLDSEPELIEPVSCRFLPLQKGAWSRSLASAALYAYWLIGKKRRHRPYTERNYSCMTLLRSTYLQKSLVYEEARLTSSDSRFALAWINQERSHHHLPINHCTVRSGRWDRARNAWELHLTDQVTGTEHAAWAKALINAGGVWADDINQTCGLESNYRHIFSKGVYLVVRRPPELDEVLVFEGKQHGAFHTLIPWGPVALWGPTETAVHDLQSGFAPTVEDLRILLEQANRHLRKQHGPEDVISLRCGVRPLAVKSSFRSDRHPLDLSRRHVVSHDPRFPALTLYGGKITSAPCMAQEAADALAPYLPPGEPEFSEDSLQTQSSDSRPDLQDFPGMPQALPDPRWCVENEDCVTLDDYVRRRTNVAQWIPRLGLGANNENEQLLFEIADAIYASQQSLNGGRQAAHQALIQLRRAADLQDQLLGAV